MVPKPSASSSFDLWNQESTTGNVVVDFLMPNGLLIPLQVNRELNLSELKEDLWDEAQKYPLYGTLRDGQYYVFMCVNQNAEQEELVDETRRLCDVRPFQSVLKVVERKGDKAEKLLNAQIGLLIGKGVHEFDALRNPEVNDFRWKMRALCEEIAGERERREWKSKMLYKFPERLANDADLPAIISDKIAGGMVKIVVRFEKDETSFTFHITKDMLPMDLLSKVLSKKSNTTGKQEDVKDYVLKVVGQEEYLISDHAIFQYKYIQNMISQGRHPQLVLVSVRNIIVDDNLRYENLEDVERRKPRPSYSSTTLGSRKRPKAVLSWSVTEPFSVCVNAVCRLNCDSLEVGIRAGLVHGDEALCSALKTKVSPVADGEAKWHETLVFDIAVCDIPRMTRLCMVVYEVTRNAKGPKPKRSRAAGPRPETCENPLAWVNTTVFDFKNQLKTGSVTLYMWTYAEDLQSDDMIHRLGTVVSNPSVDNATALTVTFARFSDDNSVVYPAIETVTDFANEDPGQDSASLSYGTPHASKAYLEQMRQTCEKDPLHQMHEQEKELLWFLRQDCQYHLPHSLPKLLHCVKWNDHNDVAQMMNLLQRWPHVAVENALELLDYAYPDCHVRKFAVQCLRDISDEDLLLYLLQLVQALKHESYLYSDLVEFLLRRALRNQRIGHYLFWHLRSEMHVPAVSVRFGLILEAYCRGSVEHMRSLQRQLDALNKWRTVHGLIRQKKEPRERVRQFMLDTLKKNYYSDVLSNIQCPMNPSLRCRTLKVEKCKFMDSKMKPLWIVWKNEDVFGEDIYVIFKDGDDLRQDMLTLQIIRIMDKLWKDEGLDLRMNPYGCISTDHKLGLIEVVLEADTIANIQKEKGLFSAASTFKKGSLLAWLKEHNTEESRLTDAVEEFTLSCAGYCVATYILGIADRHSDNIMVKRNGQLFHIDFGHILGHFKEKFGIRRERVPFVITHDFVHVITKGQNQRSQEFTRFQNYCEQAFQILRRKGSFIISLFAMMLSTGIPELSSEKDLGYLRDTLVLDLSEADALKHFRSKFEEALQNSWKTSLNWLAHNLAKDNKMND